MDIWQLRHRLYRLRRKADIDLHRWIQRRPSQIGRAVNAVWPALRLAIKGVSGVAQVCVLSVISPWVLLADIFRRGRRVEHRWLLYLAVLALALGLGNWALDRSINQRFQHSLTTLEQYLQYTQDKTTVQNVPYSDLINRYAMNNHLDPALLASVVACESSFDPEAISQAGARGLMQIMPATWVDLNPGGACRGDHLPPSEGLGCIFDPETNIRLGSRYLRELLDEFGGNAVPALAAYNAGRGTVHLYAATTGGLPPYPETQGYLHSVTRVWSSLRSGGNLGMLFQPQQLQIWQDRLNFASLMMWGIAGAWLCTKLVHSPVARRL